MADVIFGDDWTEDLPQPEDMEWEDIEDQIEEEYIKTDSDAADDDPSGVLLTHVPTGVSTAAEEYRTRSENRELARDRLMDKIIEQMREIEEEDQVYPESDQMEGFDDDRRDYEDRWTPPDPEDPPWDEESSDLP